MAPWSERESEGRLRALVDDLIDSPAALAHDATCDDPAGSDVSPPEFCTPACME